MYLVGKIDKNIYKCVTGNIITDEVIITKERIEHIKERHPNDFERYQSYLSSIIKDPDYIIEDARPSTALLLKEIYDDNAGGYFRIALRLVTSSDNPEYKNSIVTFWKTRKKEYERLIKNKNILYKRK